MTNEFDLWFEINCTRKRKKTNKKKKKKQQQKNTTNKVYVVAITKTRLFKYIENFTSTNWKFSAKKLIFFKFLLKT